jgi:predicted TIM-barrel fold metal-dependent hydrolase
MSGGHTIERHAMELGLIGREIGIEKLVWGSDCAPEAIAQHIERFDAMFDMLELDDEARDRLWWRNAAEIYGLEEPQVAGE